MKTLLTFFLSLLFSTYSMAQTKSPSAEFTKKQSKLQTTKQAEEDTSPGSPRLETQKSRSDKKVPTSN